MLLSATDRAGIAGRTRAAQIGAAVLFVAAGAIIALGVPGLKLPSSRTLDTDPAAVVADVAGPSAQLQPQVNYAAIADRLAMINNKPVLPVVVEPPKSDGAVVEAVAPPPVAEIAKYLGPVSLGATKMALIVKDEKQIFIKIGDKVGDATLESVSDASLSFTINGSTTTVELTPKGTDVVTHAGAGGGGASSFQRAGGKALNQMGRTPNNNQNIVAAQRAELLRAQASRRNSGVVPVQNSPGFAYGHIMADPQRRARFSEIQTKLRGTGEYKSAIELDEAAAKLTEEEFQQTSGMPQSKPN